MRIPSKMTRTKDQSAGPPNANNLQPTKLSSRREWDYVIFFCDYSVVFHCGLGFHPEFGFTAYFKFLSYVSFRRC